MYIHLFAKPMPVEEFEVKFAEGGGSDAGEDEERKHN